MTHTILVVDDEQALRNVLSDKLELEGYKVLQARDGLEGLNLALSSHPDLIVLDIVMPVSDGMTMLQRLREDEWGSTVKVILLTNLSDENKVAESLKLGIFDYLVKADWRLEDLVTKVKERLDKKL